MLISAQIDTQPAAAKDAPGAESNPALHFQAALAALKEQLDKLPVGAVATQAAQAQAEAADDDDDVKVTIKMPAGAQRKR